MLGKAAMIAVLLAPTASIARHDDHSTAAKPVRWFNVALVLTRRTDDSHLRRPHSFLQAPLDAINASGKLGLYPPPCGEGGERSEPGGGGADPHPQPLPSRSRVYPISASLKCRTRAGPSSVGRGADRVRGALVDGVLALAEAVMGGAPAPRWWLALV